MVWSHAVGPDGTVTGLEFDPGFAKHAGDALAANGVKNVEIIVGPAAERYVSFSSLSLFSLVVYIFSRHFRLIIHLPAREAPCLVRCLALSFPSTTIYVLDTEYTTSSDWAFSEPFFRANSLMT